MEESCSKPRIMCYPLIRSLIVQTGKRSRAARFCGSLVLLSGLALLIGCGTKAEQAPNSQSPKKPTSAAKDAPPRSKPAKPDNADAPESAMALATTGGELRIGDPIEKAKTVFPKPADGEISNPPDFLAKGQVHWGWKSKTSFFDALAEKGKLVWLSYMDKSLDKTAREKEIARELGLFGEPAENAEGKAASIYSWERGKTVRVLLNLNAGKNIGLLRVVGLARVLQSQLPLGNLGELVRSLDQSQ